MKTYRRKAEYQDKEAAENYLGRFSRANGKKEHEATVAALTLAIDRIPGVKRILDVPCGAGRFADLFYEKGHSYIGADVSQEMIEVFLGRQRSQGIFFPLVRCEAESLPFKDSVFDCVACIRFLNQYIPAEIREKMLQEMRRVSRRWLVVQSHRLRPIRPFTHAKIFVKKLLGKDVSRYQIREGILKEGWKEEERIPIKGKAFYVGVYRKEIHESSGRSSGKE